MAVDAYIAGTDQFVSVRDGHLLDRFGGGGAFKTIMGANAGDNYIHSDLTTRNSDLGRLGMNRGPYYNSLAAMPSTFPTATMLSTRCSEKRSVVSLNIPPSDVNAGLADSKITSYALSVPVDWWVGFVYFSEPNGEILGGQFTNAEHKQACIRISTLLAGLSSANRVVPVIIYSAPVAWNLTGQWNNSWIWNFSEMNNPNAIWSWDNYGNPFGGGVDGTGQYGPKGQYPPVDGTTDPSYNLLGPKGWLFENGHWARTEFNAPRRDGPGFYGPSGDANEAIRSQWLTDYVDRELGRATKPKMLLLWEGDGTQFDQNFHTTAPFVALKPYYVAGGP